MKGMHTDIFEKQQDIPQKQQDIPQKQQKEEKKAVSGIKEELSSEFYYLKKATKEFDNFKSKIDGLNLPENVKNFLVKEGENLFYGFDNDKTKLEGMKLLNETLDYIIKESRNCTKEELMHKVKQNIEKYLHNDDFEAGNFVVLITALAAWLVMALAMTELLTYSSLAVIGILYTLSIGGSIVYVNEKSNFIQKNKLFDKINNMFPQITQEEFNKLYDLYSNGKINMQKFEEMMNEYERDGKITKEERKKIHEFLGIK